MADFYIKTAPVSITFTCPHCGADIEIPWRNLNPPEYWGDPWDDIECPDCGMDVELDEYDIG